MGRTLGHRMRLAHRVFPYPSKGVTAHSESTYHLERAMYPMVGRRAELEAIEAFIDRAQQRTMALVLEGEAGIGKTTLWQAGVAMAQERGFRVLSAQPAQSEAQLAYASVADLMAGVDDELIATLPQPQREALEVALLKAAPGASPPQHRAIAAGLLAVVRRLSEDGPVLLAVDDVQWLDRSSARAIEFTTRRLTGPAGVLVSLRTGGQSEAAAPVTISALDQVVHLEIGPLSLGALHQLIKERAGRSLSRPALVRIQSLTAGNPFFALELVREVGDGPILTPSARLPRTLTELARARLRGLDPELGRVLLAAAALTAPTVELLSRVIDGDASRLLDQAQDRAIVELAAGRVRFTHPLLASGVYAMASAAHRRAIHRRIAATDGLDSEERARHLALTATGPDAETIAALDDAADHARHRGATIAAADLLDLALELGAVDAERRIRAATYHFDAGNPSRARLLLESTIAELPPGPARADALRVLASVRLHDDSYQDADGLLRQAMAEAGGDTGLRVRVVLELLYVLVNTGRVDEALVYVDQILDEAEQVGDRGLIAQALAVSTTVRFLNGRGLDEPRLDRSLSLEDLERATPVMFRPSLMAGLLYMWTGRLDEAREALYRLRRHRLERGEESDLLFIGFETVMLECWRGDLASARQIADDTLERALAIDTDVAHAIGLAARAFASAYAGDAAEARQAAQTALALFQRGTLTVASQWPVATLGFLDLSEDDFESAAQLLAPMATAAAAMGIHEPMVLTFAADAAEALIGSSRTAEAALLVDHLETAGRRLDRAWALATGGRCRALLLGAAGRLDEAVDAAERALEHHERLAMPFERARTLLVLGRLQRRSGHRRAARESIAKAFRTFEELGCALWVAKARGELQRLGTRAGDTSQLTPSEERVAELAARGLTNRQVAAAMLVSPKTVEANLSRVYRKLDIRTRAELGRHMAHRLVADAQSVAGVATSTSNPPPSRTAT